MAITFAYRSDKVAPRFVSEVTQTQNFINSSSVTPSTGVVADSSTGLIGSTILDVSTTGAAYRYVSLGNVPITDSDPFSVLCRVVPRFTGNPSNQESFYGLGGPGGIYYFYPRHNTNGTIQFLGLSLDSAFAVNASTSVAWGQTADRAYDILFTWDGTTTAGAQKIFIDAVSAGTATASTTTGYATSYQDSIFLGGLNTVNWRGNYDINEFVIWNEVIDPTSVTLTTGNGQLNGASRTAFVDVAESDGTSGSGGGGRGPKLGSSGFF